MRTLVLIAALLWASTSGWWYVCHIKGHCGGDSEVTLANTMDIEKDKNKETHPNDEPEKPTESLDTNENTVEIETIDPEVLLADNEESSSSIASQMTEEELAEATENIDEAIKADNAEAAQSEEMAMNDAKNNTDNSNTDADNSDSNNEVVATNNTDNSTTGSSDSNNEVVATNNTDNSTTDSSESNSEIDNSVEDIAILESINLKEDKDLSKIKIDRIKKSSSDANQDSTIKINKVRVYLPRTVSKQTASNTNAELYLDKVVEMLNADDSLKISLIGYTDSTGGDARNKAIGLRRAKILKSILVNKGAPAARIIADSKGEEDPIWSNKSKSGREKNRRVELTQFIEVEIENKEQE